MSWGVFSAVSAACSMSLSEFDLIREFFSTPGLPPRDDVVRGIGDDGAVLQVPADRELVLSLDTLVAGVHFPVDTPPEDVGYKVLAVGLSDLAAMGAEPAWATLALTLPGIDRQWLKQFSQALLQLAGAYQMQLVGGDTTRGPLTISLQVHGFVPRGTACYRSGAQRGDLVCVTGTLGDAGLALHAMKQASCRDSLHYQQLLDRLQRPQPRVRAALAIRHLVHAMIDISDGLLADLGHILALSGVGACLYVDRVPLSQSFVSMRDCLEKLHWLDVALSAGDDYELCFTVAPDQLQTVQQQLSAAGCVCSCVGEIVDGAGLQCRHEDGRPFQPSATGFDHFAAAASTDS